MEKGVALLSGGIDSPVAIHLMQDRLDIIAVHFHQLPLTDEKEIDKVKELVGMLKLKKLYLIPFAESLKLLVEKCEHKNYFILGKILMFKIAELIADKENAKFLITGENLAQVSSQTLSNLRVITKNLHLEIFRPVLTYDKQEIIDLAKIIGTYDISKGPEICSLLGPKHPATRSNPEAIEKELDKLGLDLNYVLEKAEIIEN
jgi:tRNA uracil 4-sulfurtransferase